MGLNARHPYESQPWDWFVITRPVAFFWQSYTNAAGTHLAKPGTTGPYVSEVLAIGNPAIWWLSIPAIVFCLAWWLTRRDWRAGAAVLGVAAGWVSWLPFVSRTKFYYYALEFEPFVIICIVLCLGLILGSATAVWWRRALGAAVVGLYVLTVVILFWYFYPILAAQGHPVLGVAAPICGTRRLDLTGRNGAAACPGRRPAWLLSRLSVSAKPAPDLATYLEVI